MRDPVILNVPVNDPTFDPETEEIVQYRGEAFPRIRPKHAAEPDPAGSSNCVHCGRAIRREYRPGDTTTGWEHVS